MDSQKSKILNLTKGVYDIQKLRIATGNRIVQSFNIQMGQEPSTKQESMNEDAQKLITVLSKEYKRITDAYINKSFDIVKIENDKKIVKTISVSKNAGIERVINTMTSTSGSDIKYILSKTDYELMTTYVDLLETERRMTRILTKEVEKHPMWDAFFKDVKGCGPLMAAVCISYFDVNQARHASSFWKYAGLDVVLVADDETAEIPTYHGEGRSRAHTEVREYTDKTGEVKKKKSITFNPELKTKLIGVLGPSFIKIPGSYYERVYRNYRNRLEHREDLKDLSLKHKHSMAVRYMIKIFIADMWATWRKLEGYEVSEPYEVAKLGMKPHKYNEYRERLALNNHML